MDITLIEWLKIVLLFFGVIALIWLSAVLFRIYKILWPVLEILAIYNKIKWIFSVYSQIPDALKDKVKSFIKK